MSTAVAVLKLMKNKQLYEPPAASPPTATNPQ